VNGARSFRSFMQRLAVVAVLLMLLAPLISRWQQSHSLPMDDPLLCQSEEHAQHHAGSSSKHHGKDQHEDHGIACDYCVLLTRLVPLLVWLCLFPIRLRTSAPDLHLALLAPQAAYWPVPPPRGPPLYC